MYAEKSIITQCMQPLTGEKPNNKYEGGESEGKRENKNKNKGVRRKIENDTTYATPYRKSKDD